MPWGLFQNTLRHSGREMCQGMATYMQVLRERLQAMANCLGLAMPRPLKRSKEGADAVAVHQRDENFASPAVQQMPHGMHWAVVAMVQQYMGQTSPTRRQPCGVFGTFQACIALAAA